MKLNSVQTLEWTKLYMEVRVKVEDKVTNAIRQEIFNQIAFHVAPFIFWRDINTNLRKIT